MILAKYIVLLDCNGGLQLSGLAVLCRVPYYRLLFLQKMPHFDDTFHGKLFFLQNMCTHNVPVCIPKVFQYNVEFVRRHIEGNFAEEATPKRLKKILFAEFCIIFSIIS